MIYLNNHIWKFRSGFPNVLNQINKGQLTLGFLGGSITEEGARHNWPEPVVAWFVEHYPEVRIIVENAGIGGTGSENAVFRAQRDIIDRNCDLVFVEYAVNDSGAPADRRLRTREGLLRKLLATKGKDVIIVYTYHQEMYTEMSQDRIPSTIAEFEQLAEHYAIGSVWMGLYAYEEVKRGRMRWEEWLPDGTHPTSRGSLSYAHSVIAFLEKELMTDPNTIEIKTGDLRPDPLHPSHWEHSTPLNFSEVKLTGPWSINRYTHSSWIDQVLSTSAVGAKLAFQFTGRGLSLGFDFGKDSAEFRYRLDEGEWQIMIRDRPDWTPPQGGWYQFTLIADDLAYTRHSFELEVIHGNSTNCTGTNFRLGLIGIIR